MRKQLPSLPLQSKTFLPPRAPLSRTFLPPLPLSMVALGKPKINESKILFRKGVISIEKALHRMGRARLRSQF